MDSITCECASKSINKLENAIEYLLKKGKKVNQLLDNEKSINDQRRMEEVEELKNKMKRRNRELEKEKKTNRNERNFDVLNSSKTNSEPKILMTNKRIPSRRNSKNDGFEMEVPSLPFESSTKSISKKQKLAKNKDVKQIVETIETKETSTETVTSIRENRNEREFITIKDNYLVEKSDFKTDTLPSVVKFKQLSDGSMDMIYSFLDESGKSIFNVDFNLNGDKVQNVKFNGKVAIPASS